jgi:hypothetical protein
VEGLDQMAAVAARVRPDAVKAAAEAWNNGHPMAARPSMSCAAAQIQPTCRTVGHLGGVPFRLLGDRERPAFRAEGAIER